MIIPYNNKIVNIIIELNIIIIKIKNTIIIELFFIIIKIIGKKIIELYLIIKKLKIKKWLIMLYNYKNWR